ncbi:MAG: hypothetical protein KOO66_03265 [Bacteroidales bacterium]|nr:hypothetical protein [Bacteroidales bacterium]
MNTNNYKKFLSILIIGFVGILLFSSCANKEVVDACLEGQTYGFWGGLLHGIIAPFDLIAMLFRDDVTVYAQNNNGAWYAFGFIIGSGGWGILGSKGASNKKRRRNK